MRKCKQNGCRKYARSGSTRCCRHSFSAHENNHHKKDRLCAIPCKKMPKRDALVAAFHIADTDLLQKIESIVHSSLETNGHTLPFPPMGGQRLIIKMDATQTRAMAPLLIKGARKANQLAKNFRCKKPKILAPIIIVAPPAGRRSTSWTKGPIHRDYVGQAPGVYSFMLTLDNLVLSNGTVEIWPKSARTEANPKHPGRAMEKSGIESECLTGNKGTIFIWDSRLLHRSLPNSDSNARITLHWFVSSKKIEVDI